MKASEHKPAVRDIVAEARAAAAAGNEEGGEEGAAGKAAARAASLGLQATSQGYASLGGVEHHVSFKSSTTLNIQEYSAVASLHSFMHGLRVHY